MTDYQGIAQAALRAVDALLLEGFRPRVVIYHAGVGLGMFLKDLLRGRERARP